MAARINFFQKIPQEFLECMLYFLPAKDQKRLYITNRAILKKTLWLRQDQNCRLRDLSLENTVSHLAQRGIRDLPLQAVERSFYISAHPEIGERRFFLSSLFLSVYPNIWSGVEKLTFSQCNQTSVSLIEQCLNLQELEIQNFQTQSLPFINSLVSALKTKSSLKVLHVDVDNIRRDAQFGASLSLDRLFHSCGKELKDLRVQNYSSVRSFLWSVLKNCPNLERLDLEGGALFSEEELACALQFKSLRFLKFGPIDKSIPDSRLEELLLCSQPELIWEVVDNFPTQRQK